MKKIFITAVFILVLSFVMTAFDFIAVSEDIYEEAIAAYVSKGFNEEQLRNLTAIDVLETAGYRSVWEESIAVRVEVLILMDFMGVSMAQVLLDTLTVNMVDEEGVLLGYAYENTSFIKLLDSVLMDERSATYYTDGMFYYVSDGNITKRSADAETDMETFQEYMSETDLYTDHIDFFGLGESAELASMVLTENGIVMEFDVDGGVLGEMATEMFDQLFNESMGVGNILNVLGADEELNFGYMLLTVGVDFEGYLRFITVEATLTLGLSVLPGARVGVGFSVAYSFPLIGNEVEIDFPEYLFD
jgi:hypothetical protein